MELVGYLNRFKYFVSTRKKEKRKRGCGGSIMKMSSPLFVGNLWELRSLDKRLGVLYKAIVEDMESDYSFGR